MTPQEEHIISILKFYQLGAKELLKMHKINFGLSSSWFRGNGGNFQIEIEYISQLPTPNMLFFVHLEREQLIEQNGKNHISFLKIWMKPQNIYSFLANNGSMGH